MTMRSVVHELQANMSTLNVHVMHHIIGNIMLVWHFFYSLFFTDWRLSKKKDSTEHFVVKASDARIYAPNVKDYGHNLEISELQDIVLPTECPCVWRQPRTQSWRFHRRTIQRYVLHSKGLGYSSKQDAWGPMQAAPFLYEVPFTKGLPRPKIADIIASRLNTASMTSSMRELVWIQFGLCFAYISLLHQCSVASGSGKLGTMEEHYVQANSNWCLTKEKHNMFGEDVLLP